MPQPLRIVIVGGVAGGASAATRARRLAEDASIVLFERGPVCVLRQLRAALPHGRRHPGALTAPDADAGEPQRPVRHGRADAYRSGGHRTGRQGGGGPQPEDRQGVRGALRCPGAQPRGRAHPPGHPRGVRGAGVHLAQHGGHGRHPPAVGEGGVRRALVAGAGYIGLELVEQLRRRGLDVVLVEKLDHVMGLADPEMTMAIREELAAHQVDVRLGRSVAAFREAGQGLSVASWTAASAVACDLAVLGVGVRPETRLAKDAGLALGSTGGILVDDRMRTSRPDIYAVGDAVEVRDLVSGDPALVPLAGPANRQGRIAAEVILGRDSRYRGTQGTAICKVFDLSFATTGLTETALKRKGLPYRRVYVFPPDHAAYYPGAQAITLKLLFEPEQRAHPRRPGGGPRRGGQAHRRDRRGPAGRSTVFDLEHLELCYAPPFGGAKDAVNMAGFVAANVLRGDVDLWEPEELEALARRPAAGGRAHVPGARRGHHPRGPVRARGRTA